ncbi:MULTISPECIES: hypothetical protein [unclassified Adlercreutzia]|uniref:hypothetical protein n=1 Tax=unclassified Adlercreutzia TaxID=2636013 RepID=UPI0013ED451E|nr:MULTISPECIES: hypothetical protein [unclassified Adlercreutzia]
MLIYKRMDARDMECFFEDRAGYEHKFSRSGLEAVVGFYEDNDIDTLFDVVGFACSWREYGSNGELFSNYEYLLEEEYGEPDGAFEDLVQKLRDRTVLLETESGGYVAGVF